MGRSKKSENVDSKKSERVSVFERLGFGGSIKKKKKERERDISGDEDERKGGARLRTPPVLLAAPGFQRHSKKGSHREGEGKKGGGRVVEEERGKKRNRERSAEKKSIRVGGRKQENSGTSSSSSEERSRMKKKRRTEKKKSKPSTPPPPPPKRASFSSSSEEDTPPPQEKDDSRSSSASPSSRSSSSSSTKRKTRKKQSGASGKKKERSKQQSKRKRRETPSSSSSSSSEESSSSSSEESSESASDESSKPSAPKSKRKKSLSPAKDKSGSILSRLGARVPSRRPQKERERSPHTPDPRLLPIAINRDREVKKARIIDEKEAFSSPGSSAAKKRPITERLGHKMAPLRSERDSGPKYRTRHRSSSSSSSEISPAVVQPVRLSPPVVQDRPPVARIPPILAIRTSAPHDDQNGAVIRMKPLSSFPLPPDVSISPSPPRSPPSPSNLVLTWPPLSPIPSPPPRIIKSEKKSKKKKTLSPVPPARPIGPDLPPDYDFKTPLTLSPPRRRYSSIDRSPSRKSDSRSGSYRDRRSESERTRGRSPSPSRSRSMSSSSLFYRRESYRSSRRNSRSPSPLYERRRSSTSSRYSPDRFSDRGDRRKHSPIRIPTPPRGTPTSRRTSRFSDPEDRMAQQLTVHNVLNLNLSIQTPSLSEGKRESVFSRIGTPSSVLESSLNDSSSSLNIVMRSPAIELAKTVPVLMNIPYVDSHFHLDFIFNGRRNLPYQNFTELRADMSDQYAQFRGGIAIFCNPKTNANITTFQFLNDPLIYGAVGCHPHFVPDFERFGGIERIRKHITTNRGILAVGEIGLDYPDSGAPLTEELEKLQKNVFRQCLKLGVEMKLPLVLHIRNAEEDAFEICKEEVPRDHPMHLHCFNYPYHVAQKWLVEYPNACVGITPMITYPGRNHNTQDLGAKIPLDRLLLESDSPYFVPQQVIESSTWGRKLGARERFSHPAHAFYVAVEVCRLRRYESLEEICRITGENMIKLYRCKGVSMQPH